jgi:hypothetical protein
MAMISLRVVQLGEATHSAFLQLAAEAREHSRAAARADDLDEPADMLVRLFIDMPWARTQHAHSTRAGHLPRPLLV